MRIYLLLTLAVGVVLAKKGYHKGKSCPRIDTITRPLNDAYCEQPLFVNFVAKSSETELLDNICITLFPLPDDPSTFQTYASLVYCDGSFEVISFIATDISQGVIRAANPFSTITIQTFGYAGCDTYISQVCSNFGANGFYGDIVVGLASSCQPIGLSCLRKIEEIIRDHCIAEQEFYVLPMKLPNRCVTQRQCVASQNNLFHKSIGLAGPLLGTPHF